jgi:hypothetical protein
MRQSEPFDVNCGICYYEHMGAQLVENRKLTLDDGSIIQIRIWRLPAITAERPHGLKYSLVYGRQGERIIRYDNEAGKGDHRHYRGKEKSYRFTTYEELIRDFMDDVSRELRR